MPGWQGQRGTSTERGYGAKWRKIRVHAMRRDNWLCQPCQREGRITPATECDHIKPKAQGGMDSMDNLQAICNMCHRAKTTREAAEAQGRRVVDRLAFDHEGRPMWPKGR